LENQNKTSDSIKTKLTRNGADFLRKLVDWHDELSSPPVSKLNDTGYFNPIGMPPDFLSEFLPESKKIAIKNCGIIGRFWLNSVL